MVTSNSRDGNSRGNDRELVKSKEEASIVQLWNSSTMSAPGKNEVAPVAQLSFVFGNSVVKSQTSHCLLEDAEQQQITQYYLTETLCLSRSKLKCVVDSIFNHTILKHLYLEGNQICSIPPSLFISLPNLQWLDLRNNQIVSLPAEIGMHRSLKTLLLEGNPLSELPPELGNVITLKGLNLRNCPITFPPQDILQQGLQSILQYLRNILAMRPVSQMKALPELPVVEKLQLSELMGCSIEGQDESVDEDELLRFEELKDQMIQLDRAELNSIVESERNPKSRFLPITKRKKATTKARIIPELPLSDTKHGKRPEEKRQAAKKELKEKQALLEQRRKCQEALQKWRTQAKILQQKKAAQHKQKKDERQEKPEESKCSPQRQSPILIATECNEYRTTRELEREIRARVESMQERRRNPRGTASEQIAAAEQDMKEMKKLQQQLLENKKNMGRDSKKSFKMFTGDTWPSFPDK